MSKPIGSNPFNHPPVMQSTCVMSGFFKHLTEGLNKAFTPCEVYCKEQWESNPDIRRVDDYMQRCIKDCKDFQRRMPD